MMGGHDEGTVATLVRQTILDWHAAAERRKWAALGDDAPLAARDVPAYDVAGTLRNWNIGTDETPFGITVVLVEQLPSGLPKRIETTRSTGWALLDESVHRTFEGVAEGLDVPEHGLGLGDDAIRSIWRFEARTVPRTCTFFAGPAGNLAYRGAAMLERSPIECNTFGRDDESTQVSRTHKVIVRVDLLAVLGGETRPSAPASPH